jgi:prepilin-type N-terminal cleavage/methylation domain-containing protein
MQNAEFRIQRPVLRRNAPAFFASQLAPAKPRAFTLIELLVVIGVIVTLAALSFPAMQAVKVAQARQRARAELTQIETAIETFKTKLGFYPPDNAPNWIVNQLYYELMGTTVTTIGAKQVYQTLDGSASISNFPAAFGARVTGFMNCAKANAGDDVAAAVPFLKGLKERQFLAITNGVSKAPVVTLLGSAIGGATVFYGTTGELTPYGYNSSSPQHNPKSFDLWVDIIAGGKTNRISNWSTRPIIVYYLSIANSYPP